MTTDEYMDKVQAIADKNLTDSLWNIEDSMRRCHRKGVMYMLPDGWMRRRMLAHWRARYTWFRVRRWWHYRSRASR